MKTEGEYIKITIYDRSGRQMQFCGDDVAKGLKQAKSAYYRKIAGGH